VTKQIAVLDELCDPNGLVTSRLETDWTEQVPSSGEDQTNSQGRSNRRLGGR